MDPVMIFGIIAALLLAEGFFSGSEIGLAAINRVRLRHLAEQGKAYARILEDLLSSPARIFGVTSIGTNLCVFASSSLMAWYMLGIVGEERADLYAFFIMGPATLILGEIVPKMIVRSRAEQLAPYYARPLSWAQALFAPLLAVTTFLSKMFMAHILRQKGIPADFISREEILALAELSHKNLELDRTEQLMLDRIFDFKSSEVTVAMRPLGKVLAAPDYFPLERIQAMLAESGHSRLPVFHDRIFNIVGVISAFDILRNRGKGGSVTDIMTPAYYVPDTKRNSRLLAEMQKSGVHMAVVVDEYGSAVGIVTQEDLIEEIVGEIEDEYDTSIKSYEMLGDGRYVIDAGMEVDKINEELGLDIPTGDYETLAGFLNQALERIPRKRERMAIGHLGLTMLEATKRRVMSVEIVDLSREKPESGGENGKGD